MAREEKSFPLVVTTEETSENARLISCGEENCRKWGSGVLQVEKAHKGTGCAAKLFLTMAGCEVCPGPTVRQRDLDIIPGFPAVTPQPYDAPADNLLETARELLADRVNTLLIPDDKGWLL